MSRDERIEREGRALRDRLHRQNRHAESQTVGKLTEAMARTRLAMHGSREALRLALPCLYADLATMVTSCCIRIEGGRYDIDTASAGERARIVALIAAIRAAEKHVDRPMGYAGGHCAELVDNLPAEEDGTR